jgi:hypothetical protein
MCIRVYQEVFQDITKKYKKSELGTYVLDENGNKIIDNSTQAVAFNTIGGHIDCLHVGVVPESNRKIHAEEYVNNLDYVPFSLHRGKRLNHWDKAAIIKRNYLSTSKPSSTIEEISMIKKLSLDLYGIPIIRKDVKHDLTNLREKKINGLPNHGWVTIPLSRFRPQKIDVFNSFVINKTEDIKLELEIEFGDEINAQIYCVVSTYLDVSYDM